MRLYNKDFKKIVYHIGGSRTRLQVQNFTKKVIKCLEKNSKHKDIDILEKLKKPIRNVWSDKE